MGCSSAKSGGLGLDGHSTKVWLHIEDVAASVQALPRKDGSKGMTVVVAGMDKYGLVGVLESSFRQRGLEIESGGWALKGTLFHATFHLAPVMKTISSNELGIVRQLRTEVCSVEPDAFIPNGHLKAPSQIKIDVEHTMGEELHVGLLNLINECGGRTVRANFLRVPTRQISGSSIAGERVAGDTFWVEHHDKQSLIRDALSSSEILQQRLCSTRAALEDRVDKTAKLDDDSCVVDKDATGSLLNALRLADRTALQKLVLELPVAVMDRVRKTPYIIKPSSWGHQVEGFQKYMGAGIVMGAENDGAPVVQFTSLFVQSKNVAHTGAQKIRRTLASLKTVQYGEFVNSIDVNRQRFTIERVFLNGVIPSGYSIGAHATAEQLFAPVWEKGVHWQGPGDVLPVHKIKEIKISDAVNWNTYAVLSVALIERGEHDDMFGEHFQAALNTELEASGLTRDDCKTMPLVQIVLRTVLGKLVARILDQWHKRTSVCLTCTSAVVTFRSGKEMIAGEARAAMDVVFQVHADVGASLDSTGRQLTADRQVSTLSATGEAADALQQWVAKIREASGGVDHGFALGKVGVHDMIHQRPALLAVRRAIHFLQQERGWSCKAVADGLDDHTAEELSKHRNSTDEALVAALQLTTSRSIRAVSTSLILLRTVVDQNLNSESGWEDRYKLVCSEPRAFNMVVGTLIEWLVSACKMHPEIPQSSAESLMMFCYFGEQLGRERAFVTSRGRGRSLITATRNAEGVRSLVLMSATRNLIGDLLQINARFANVFRQLDEAETRFMADDDHDPQNWFTVITLCIDLVQRLIDDLIGVEHAPQEDEEREEFSI